MSMTKTATADEPLPPLQAELSELCSAIGALVRVNKTMSEDIAELHDRIPARDPGYYMGEARRIDSELADLLAESRRPRRENRKRLKRSGGDAWKKIALFMMAEVI